jgi:hypothetical protein
LAIDLPSQPKAYHILESDATLETDETHGEETGTVRLHAKKGVWYASGLFERTPTLMHVSRGLSGVHPLRFHCPPELTLLELRCSGSRA